MEQQTFADGIGRIAIIDGIVRLDLVAHSATETGADGKPVQAFAHRIVMGVDQFLRAAEKIAETRRLIEQHQARTAPQAPAAPQAAPARPAAQQQQPAYAPQPQQAYAPQPNRPQSVPQQFRRESVRPDPSTRPFP